jgi:LacI family transcriptional regulator
VGFHDITNPYFSEMLTAIEAAANANGQGILLGTYSESSERQARVLNLLREHRPDGMLICPAGGTGPEAFDALVAAGIPIVQVSREIEDSGLDFVGADDARGTGLAVEHLVALGHRRIAMLGGTAQISTGRARQRGFRDAMRAAGLDPSLVHEGFGTRETGLQGIRTLLDAPEIPTAVVCFNDVTAFGVLMGLRHLGLEAGRDISVVGCDDVQEAALWHPGLTTVRNRQDEMGAIAADLLMNRINEPSAVPRRILLQPTLVVRGSTAPPQG